MKEKLAQIKAEALKQIEASEQLDKLNEIRVNYLGKKGQLTAVLKSMKEVAPEDRPKVGQMVNETGSENEGRGNRCDASGKEKQRRPPASEYDCAGRSGKDFCWDGL